jgi:hypothetical protein
MSQLSLGDLAAQLAAHLLVISAQGVANNQQLSLHTPLAFQKDLFQSGQSSNAGIMAAFAAANRTPVVLAAPAAAAATVAKAG